jgi:putative SOS response-associated peptidase YedK
MCARHTVRTPADLLAARSGRPQVPDLRPRYNVSPTQAVPVIGEGWPCSGGASSRTGPSTTPARSR